MIRITNNHFCNTWSTLQEWKTRAIYSDKTETLENGWVPAAFPSPSFSHPQHCGTGCSRWEKDEA